MTGISSFAFGGQVEREDRGYGWRQALLGGTALIGSLAFAGAALAQEDAATSAADEATEPLEEILVTGSRIKRSGFTSATPMDVVTAVDAEPLGFSDVASLLRSNTAAAGSPQVTSAISTAFVESGGSGVETISLRGLGANRTLTLLNGRRAGPAGIRGSVNSFDFNVIPLSAIERIEILKDGASSIYGSDAVAGVVNVITKKGDGGTLDAYSSIPFRSGGEEYNINGSYGMSFDRGNFRITADYYRREELAKGDRGYFDCGEDYIFDPVTGERDDIIDPRTGEYKCVDWAWGHNWVYDYAEYFGDNTTNVNWDNGFYLYQFDFDGHLAANNLPTQEQLSPADPANPYHIRVPEGWYPVGYDRLSYGLMDYDHPFQDEESLIPKTERITVLAEGEFEITDSITAYAEVLFNRRENYENHYAQIWTYVYNDNWSFYYYLDYDPGYPGYDGVEDGLNDTLGGPEGPYGANGWTGAQWLDPVPVIDHFDQKTTVDYFRAVGGLRGDLGSFLPDWDFDLSFQYSKSDASYWNQVVFDDAMQANNWQGTACDGTTFDRTDADGNTTTVDCIYVDWFDPDILRGNWDQATRDFLLGDETGHTVYEQYSVEASVTGPLFELPAGMVSGAFGVHYRYDSINDVPGEWSREQFPGAGNNIWLGGVKNITVGHHNTKAAFGEIEIPILSGKPMVEMLSINVSGRYTDVSSYGDGATYKTTLNWQVTPEFRVRASRGTSFRTPALFELFVKDEVSFVRQSTLDPCYRWGDAVLDGSITQRQADNCALDGIPPDHAASITGEVVTGGGAGSLDAETSTSTSVGFVLTPRALDLQVSVDYFRIEVRDEVDQLGGATIVHQCYDSEFFPNDPLCSLFDRNPQNVTFPGMITQVRDKYINIATQQNRGLDIAATYRAELPWNVNLRVDTQHTIQLRDRVELFAGFPEEHNGLIGDPKWVGNLNFTFEKGPWTATWGMRAVGKASNLGEVDGDDMITFWAGLPSEEEFRVVLSVPMVLYHSLSIARELPNGFHATLGVANLFGKDPPQISNVAAAGRKMGRSAFQSQYDWEGRRAFINLTKDF